MFNLSDLGTEYPPKIDFEGYPQPADQYSLGFYEASDELPKVVFTRVPFLCYGVKCANIATFLPSNKINIELPNAIKYGVTD